MLINMLQRLISYQFKYESRFYYRCQHVPVLQDSLLAIDKYVKAENSSGKNGEPFAASILIVTSENG